MSDTPFKFLDSFTIDDREIFFGREKEVEELYYKIFDSNLLIVYGGSGTGKTSLIQCGLAGKFQEADWMPVIIRRGENINESARKSLLNLLHVPAIKSNSLAQHIKSVYLDYFKPVYLLFDQFEELFIFGSDAEIETFADDLRDSLKAGLSCKFIFVIRGEYLEHITRFEEKIPEFFNNRIHIERMTRKNAGRAITEPAKLFNIAVAEDFPDKVLERLGGEKGTVELTYLQVYLDKLYKDAAAVDPNHPLFNEELLDRTGRIDDVLASFLDEQIAKTKSPEDALALLKSFVSGEGTKKQMSMEEIIDFTKALGKNLPREKVDHDLHQFVDLRILKDMDENGKYELRHDALATKIYEQISLVEKEMLEVRQFLINRYNDYEKRSALLQDADLQYMAPYESRLFLNNEQKQFIEKSKRAIRKKRNRRRNIAFGTGLALIIVLSGFTIFAIKQRNEALAQTKIAQQKTQEAINQKELAEKSNEMALNASRLALDAKSYAELQSRIAGEQKKIAEEQELRARQESENAVTQQNIALLQKEIAEENSKEAVQQKQKADSAKSESNRLRLLALSQSIAFQSMQFAEDKQLTALLACESYLLTEANGGNTQDPELYNALYANLKNITRGFQPVVIGSKNEVKAISISGEGKNLQALCIDGSLNSYSAGNFSFQNSFHVFGNERALNSGYLSPDGKFAIGAYEDNTIIISNTEKKTSSSPLSAHTGLVRAAAFSNDGSIFATGGRDSTVIIWNSGKAQKKIHFDSRIKAMGMSGNNTTMAVGCEDGNMYLLNISTAEKKLLLNNAPARIQSIAVSSGGKYTAFGSSNGTIHLFNPNGELLKTIADNTSSIDFLAIDEQLKMLVSVSVNKTMLVYNLADLTLKPMVIKDITRPVGSLAFAPDGRIFVSCSDNAIRQFDVQTVHLKDQLLDHITRNLTLEEWKTYIGSTEPYKKIKPELP